METTGLDPSSDAIISFGFVAMNGVSIDLSTSQHRIVRTDRSLPEQSVVIHQLTDDDVAKGESQLLVLADLFRAMAGKVLIAHHAIIEISFISATCKKFFGVDFLVPTVDTQYLAKRRLERSNQSYGGSDLRLFNLRDRYNLPRYQAHNALSDAIAAAELYAAQIEEQGGGRHNRLPLKHFLMGV